MSVRHVQPTMWPSTDMLTWPSVSLYEWDTVESRLTWKLAPSSRVIAAGGVLGGRAALWLWRSGDIPLRRQTHRVEPPSRWDLGVLICRRQEDCEHGITWPDLCWPWHPSPNSSTEDVRPNSSWNPVTAVGTELSKPSALSEARQPYSQPEERNDLWLFKLWIFIKW